MQLGEGVIEGVRVEAERSPLVDHLAALQRLDRLADEGLLDLLQLLGYLGRAEVLGRGVHEDVDDRLVGEVRGVGQLCALLRGDVLLLVNLDAVLEGFHLLEEVLGDRLVLLGHDVVIDLVDQLCLVEVVLIAVGRQRSVEVLQAGDRLGRTDLALLQHGERSVRYGLVLLDLLLVLVGQGSGLQLFQLVDSLLVHGGERGGRLVQAGEDRLVQLAFRVQDAVHAIGEVLDVDALQVLVGYLIALGGGPYDVRRLGRLRCQLLAILGHVLGIGIDLLVEGSGSFAGLQPVGHGSRHVGGDRI